MGWRRFFRRARWDEERARELDAYVQIETDENLARGMTPEEAHAAARRKLGNTTHVREQIYGFNTVGLLDTLARDVRYAARVLRRRPTFTIVAVLTLALGIGATTAVFAVVDAVLLEPLPYPNAERLVAVRNIAPGAPGMTDASGDLPLSASMFFTYADHNRMFEHIGIWTTGTAALRGREGPEEVRVIPISDGLLQALAIPPARGRWLSPADQVPGAPRTVMLMYGLWQRRFGADPRIVGQTVTLDALPYHVVGVMPRGFTIADTQGDVLVPFQFDRATLVKPGFFLSSLARLRPGVSIAQANADLARMFPMWLERWPLGNNAVYRDQWRITPAIRPLKDDVIGSVGNVLWVVMATIAVVLLMAAANVANLLLVRADERRQELATRAALGAGSWRIAREMSIESLLLAAAAAAVGIALAAAGVRALIALAPANLPRLQEIAIDGRTIAFAALTSAVAGVVLGLLPSMRYPRRIADRLRGTGRTAGPGRDRQRTQRAIAVVQVALALVLLVGAGLMIRTLLALEQVDPGFSDAAHLLTIRVTFPQQIVPEASAVLRTEKAVIDALQNVPGVRSAAFVSAMPMEERPLAWDAIYIEGRDVPAGETPPIRRFKYASPGLFSTAGTTLLAGRDFTWTDVLDTRQVVVVSENLAREVWGSPAAAVGKRIRQIPALQSWYDVIGVAKDVRDNGVQAAPPAIVYWPPFNNIQGLQPIRAATFVIRSREAGTSSLTARVQQAVWSVNPSLAVGAIRTMRSIADASMARTAFTVTMTGIAGTMALLLGIVGVYGLMSYTVTLRRREIGIRLALGERHTDVVRRFVRPGLVVVGAGIVAGMVAAAGLTRLVASLLFEVSPLDPLTYAVVAVLLIVVAALASYLPARRASAVPLTDVLAGE